MPVSEARLAANRANAQKSTGPRSDSGKAASRGNALKHGLTGDGVVLSPEAQLEVDRLDDELQADLRPASPLGRIMVRRVAFLAHRMEKCARQELVADAGRGRNAGAAFDRRQAEAEHMMQWIAAEPATYARRLRQSPEGLDLMIREWSGLATDLLKPGRVAWGTAHLTRACNLMGQHTSHFPAPRVGVLSHVIWKDTSFLAPGEADGKDAAELDGWARDAIADIIEAEIAGLRELRDNIDEESIALDRAEAPGRSLFDPSKEATLARRYEAAAERGFYRALREFREAEAEAAARPPVPAGTEKAADESVGSFFPEPAGPRPEFPQRPALTLPTPPPAPPAGDPGPMGRPVPAPWDLTRTGSR